MKRHVMFLMVALVPSLLCAADPQVKIVAYINQKFGCQEATEAFLKSLAKTHGKRVQLEFVDFGSEPGRTRWRRDGMKCMAITLNGKQEAEIVRSGVTLKVPFRMPAGYMWRHDELAIAVEQMLEGVKDADREAPQAVAKEGENGMTTFLLGDREIIVLKDRQRLLTAAETVNALAANRPIIQEELSLNGDDATATFMIREKQILKLNVADAAGDVEAFKALVVATAQSLTTCFPRVARPYPGMNHPGARR